MRHLLLGLVLVLSGCQAWGGLTTGAMTTTNAATGGPPPARQ